MQLHLELEQSQLVIVARKKLLMDDLTVAKTYFSKALSYNHLKADALCGMGAAEYLKDNLDQAEEFTALALQIAPNNARVLNHAGVLFNEKK